MKQIKEKEYISWEDAQKDDKVKAVLEEMRNDYKSTGNRLMQTVMEFFQESGGFDRQLLFYLKDHPFTDKELYLKCAPLIKDNADYRWFGLIEEMYRKGQGNYMVSEIIAAYRDGLSVEEVLKYSKKSNNAFQMSVFRKELKTEMGKTENSDIDEVVESVFSLVESVDKQKDEYERNHKELKKELDKNTIMKQDIDKLKNENRKLTDEIKNLNQELGEQRAMLAYYQSRFENAEKDKCALQNELLELQMGAARRAEQKPAENPQPSNEHTEEILELLHEILSTVKVPAISKESFAEYEESDATIQEIQEMFSQMEDVDPEDFMNASDEYDETDAFWEQDEDQDMEADKSDKDFESDEEELSDEDFESDEEELSDEDFEPDEEELDDLDGNKEYEQTEEISGTREEDTRDSEKKKRSSIFNNALANIFKKNGSRQRKEIEAENIKEIIIGMKEKQFDKDRMTLITNAMRDGVSQELLLDMVKEDMDLDEMKEQLKNIA